MPTRRKFQKYTFMFPKTERRPCNVSLGQARCSTALIGNQGQEDQQYLSKSESSE